MLAETLIYTALALVIIIVVWEWLRNKSFNEGFTDGVVPEFFNRYFPRRYDVVPGQEREGDGWIRNTRYFEGYVDVQRLGYKGDFCRVVEKEDMPDSRIMACALAGQEGLDALTFRTDPMRAGMRFSRDDYFRDVTGEKRDAYCRVLKTKKSPNDTWEALCVPAGITRFKQHADVKDNSPPQNIQDILWFYEGVMVWYRWFDDMLDYAENTQIMRAGDLKLDEEPKKVKTDGLGFNRLPEVTAAPAAGALAVNDTKPPMDQYLKIGENAALEFDTIVQLRNLRAISVWVYFDEFSNNARILDFGNGAGKDNILLGIEGRGNTMGAMTTMNARPAATNAVCRAKPVAEVSPQNFLASTDANIEEWDCPAPQDVATTYPEDDFTSTGAATANLLFEIWDAQQRKMRMRVLNCIPLKQWTHVALTTTDGTSIRPTWHVYINGIKKFEEPNGHLGQTSYVTNNYIGRSNWESVSSQYADADERFRGAMFDFRLYRAPMSASKVQRTVSWGRNLLGIDQTTKN